MRLLVAAALLALSSCAPLGGGAGAPPVTSLLEIRQRHVVMQKFDLSCGAAALTTLLVFQHGEQLSEREVATGLIGRPEYLADPSRVQHREGFSLLDLKRYVEARGYEGIGYGQLGWDDLLAHAPLMVPVDMGGYHHFVVFRGVAGRRVHLSDPAWGNRTMAIAAFQRAWIAYPQLGHVGFVVRRRGGAAPERDPAR
jgi:predicted double-glycine peptidase